MKNLGAIILSISLLFFAFTSEKIRSGVKEQYVCTPCGADCDKVIYSKGGKCSDCNMALVKRETIIHSDIDPAGLCAFVKKVGRDNVLLLDVRTKAEFDGTANEKFGRLNGAVNIPIQELENRVNEIAGWKDKQVVVYCSHSHRSPRASYILSQNGFKYVTNMSGGMSVWPASVSDKTCNQNLYVGQ